MVICNLYEVTVFCFLHHTYNPPVLYYIFHSNMTSYLGTPPKACKLLWVSVIQKKALGVPLGKLSLIFAPHRSAETKTINGRNT